MLKGQSPPVTSWSIFVPVNSDGGLFFAANQGGHQPLIFPMHDDHVPIEVYREQSLFRTCRFTLFSDRLEMVGRCNFSIDFEHLFRLADLSPDISKVRLRHPWWIAGVIMQAVPYSMFFLVQAGKRSEHGFAWSVVALLWTIGIVFEAVSLWLVIAGFPKKEYFFFRRLNGVGAFDVGRVGPDRARFDEFIASVQRQVELAKAQQPAVIGDEATGS